MRFLPAILPTTVIFCVFFYIILLFWIANKGDRLQFSENTWTKSPFVYALALGVYCTSWTFFGLVGTASDNGWEFFPILLGPILLFTVGFPILKKIFTLCKQEHIHSIADFLSSRYGKRQKVAVTVTLVVLLATIPYIALQLKAVSDALALLIDEQVFVEDDLVLVTTISMIIFALFFGAKRLDMSGYHSGIMTVLAFESLMKLLVLFSIAVFSLLLFKNIDVPSVSTEINMALSQPPNWPKFLINTFLSMCAILCLPRMFHVTFVECLDLKHLKTSRWLFSLYLLLISLCVVTIAWVGNHVLYTDANISGDTYVIALPIFNNSNFLAILAFIGGFSAATAMIIIATITLSQMLSNDVILPLILKRKLYRAAPQEFSKNIIFIRRFTVIAIVFAAYYYQIALAQNTALNSIGLAAFALAVQLFPGIIFGIYWHKGNIKGFTGGLITGITIWIFMLFIPILAEAGILSQPFSGNFLFSIRDNLSQFLGIPPNDNITPAVFISLAANIIIYILYSLIHKEELIDKIQSAAFTQYKKGSFNAYDRVDTEDLKTLLYEFMGKNQASYLIQELDKSGNKKEFIEKSQKALSGIVGIASAQTILQSMMKGKSIAVEDIVNLVGDTTKALRFNQDILFSSFNGISSGISVVNDNLQLVAWNKAYEELFNYPEGSLHIGMSISEIMLMNAKRGLLDGKNPEEEIQKRTRKMSLGIPYRFIRHHNQHMTLEIIGKPLPTGGYVTTYNNISEFIQAQSALKRANENLESRVTERTQEIETINSDLREQITEKERIARELDEARKVSEQANQSKTHFLAMAGHDIMQPINAANIYIEAIQNNQEKKQDLLPKLKASIENTESIIRTLLEISKIDNISLAPKVSTFAINDVLLPLVENAKITSEPTVTINYIPCKAYVTSNKHYLHRILQNYISNALKYTKSGKILIGCRRRKQQHKKLLEIVVIDTGQGIPKNEQQLIFNDFYRAKSQSSENTPQGLGLGLSIVSRFSELLSHPINCHSVKGKGSAFSVTVPLSYMAQDNKKLLRKPAADIRTSLTKNNYNLSIAYLDDDDSNLTAMEALLTQWGCQIHTFNTAFKFLQYFDDHYHDLDLIMVDYHLGPGELLGTDIIQEVVDRLKIINADNINICLISAATDMNLHKIARGAGHEFLSKPIKPAKISALLESYSKKKDT